MKIYIGPYTNWIGPYQLAGMIPFISEETQDKIGDWLADTWVTDLCVWIDNKKKRKMHIRIDKWDTWNMDKTLSPIILPMLIQLKATKHGSHMIDDEDVPPHMRHSHPQGECCADNWVHYKWDWVLNEMIWSFEQLADPDQKWEDQFYHGKPEFKESEIELEGETYYSVEQTNDDYHFDYEGYKAYNARIDNGLRLFGKYYRGLWD